MSVNMYQSSLKLHAQIQVGPYAWPYSSHPLSSVNLEEELSLFLVFSLSELSSESYFKYLWCKLISQKLI